MVTRKQAFAFVLGALLSVFGLFFLICGEGKDYVGFYLTVFLLGGLFLLLGRQVFLEQKAVFARHGGKLIFSAISAGLVIFLSFCIVYFKHKVYPDTTLYGGLGDIIISFLGICLILAINILMWFIVLIMSWISGRSSSKPENREE